MLGAIFGRFLTNYTREALYAARRTCAMAARRTRGKKEEEEEEGKKEGEQAYLAMSVAVLRQTCAEAGLESTGSALAPRMFARHSSVPKQRLWAGHLRGLQNRCTLDRTRTLL